MAAVIVDDPSGEAGVAVVAAVDNGSGPIGGASDDEGDVDSSDGGGEGVGPDGAGTADQQPHADNIGDGEAGVDEGAADGEDEEPVEPSVVEVSIWIDCPPEVAFDAACNTETLPDIFPGSGMVPGVESAAFEGDVGMAVGETRVVTTKDGKTVRETYVEVDRPAAYGYRMSDLNPPLSSIMSHATARWSFTAQDDGGTFVEWIYKAYPTGGMARPFNWVVVQMFLKSAMENCLERLKTMIELDLPPRWVPDEDSATCQACGADFGFFTRRHHCRQCGALVCGGCSGERKTLPQFAITKRVRVCDGCAFDTHPGAGSGGGSGADGGAEEGEDAVPVAVAEVVVAEAVVAEAVVAEGGDAGSSSDGSGDLVR